MASVNKVQFASLNDKPYYCPDGITSLPSGHPLLLQLRKRKKAFPKIQKLIKEEKNNFLKEALNAIRKHERINTFRTILSKSLSYYNIIKGPNDFCSTPKYIINSKWL